MTRDENLGRIEADTIKVNVTIATPIVDNLAKVNKEVEGVAEELRTSRKVQELILGTEVEET
jgi:hypothetical protein